VAEEIFGEVTKRDIDSNLKVQIRQVVKQKVLTMPEKKPVVTSHRMGFIPGGEMIEKFNLSKNIIQVDPKELKFHPAHSLFSNMHPADFLEMVKSVKAHGVVEPVIITPEKIVISGRQRTLAAIEAGLERIDCRTANVDENEAEMLLIISNLHRRNIPVSETIRAVYRYSQLFCLKSTAGRPKKNCAPGAQFLSKEEMAKQIGIGKRTLFQYQAIAKNLIPEFMSELDAGFLTLKAAYQIAQLPAEVQREIYEVTSNLAVVLTEKDTKDIKKSLTNVIEENWILRKRYDEVTRNLQAAVVKIEELKKSTSTKVVESPEQKEKIKQLTEELKRLRKKAKYLEKATEKQREDYKQKISKMKEALEEHQKRSIKEDLLLDFRERIDRFVRTNLRTVTLLKGYTSGNAGLSTPEKKLLKEVISPLKEFLGQLEEIL